MVGTLDPTPTTVGGHDGGDLVNRVQLAAAGLFAAWMMHDLEELATMSETSRHLVARLPRWVPASASIRDQGLTNRHVAAGIAAVGTVVAAAAVRGYRTQGQSAFYQNTLLGFGLHGFGHLGMSLATRGYISGVATSPTIVLPYWLWATRTLDRTGVPNQRNAPVALALTAGAIATGNLLAHLITKAFPRCTSHPAAVGDRRSIGLPCPQK